MMKKRSNKQKTLPIVSPQFNHDFAKILSHRKCYFYKRFPLEFSFGEEIFHFVIAFHHSTTKQTVDIFGNSPFASSTQRAGSTVCLTPPFHPIILVKGSTSSLPPVSKSSNDPFSSWMK